MRDLPRRPPQARAAGGQDRRRGHLAVVAPLGRRRARLVRRASKSSSARSSARSPAPSSRRSTSGSASSTMSGSTISTSTAPAARCRAARASASASPARSARGLSGVLYVLDEPSIGLHQKDNDRLLETLKRLRDSATPCWWSNMTRMRSAPPTMSSTWAPAPASTAAKWSAPGTLEELLACKDSLTADYLTGRRSIPLRAKRRKGTGKKLTVHGATANNLQQRHRLHPARHLHLHHRRVGLGQVELHHRHALRRRRAHAQRRAHPRRQA